MQRHAVVAVTVLAHVDQATQPALQQRQVPQLLAYRAELGLSRADDVVSRPGLRGTQQVTDFPEGEPEPHVAGVVSPRYIFRQSPANR